jgi:DNA-binding Lrp family transcriptional regulator
VNGIDDKYPYYYDMGEYSTIKEVCKRYNISSSTINRQIKKTRDNGVIRYNNEKIFSYVLLSNKVRKTLLLNNWVESVYGDDQHNDKGDNHQNDKDEKQNTTNHQNFIETLSSQLKVKDQQIERNQQTIDNLTLLLSQTQNRLDVFHKMLELKGKRLDDDIDEIKTEDTYTTSLEVEEIYTDNDTDNDVLKDLEVDLVEVDQEELKMEEKRISFLDHIRKMNKD